MADKNWKAWEREIASWLGTRRNPLSGASNVNDKGQGRAGDIIFEPALIEAKLLKRIASIGRAEKTMREAKKLNKPFLHIEREKGNGKIVCLCLTKEYAIELVKNSREQNVGKI